MGGKGGGRDKAPYEDELAAMFAAQNMMGLASRNPNASSLFRPGTKLGDSYKDLFGTSNLPTVQRFQLPDIGIASDATRRVYGSGNTPLQYMPSIQSPIASQNPFGFTRQPVTFQDESTQPVQPQRKSQRPISSTWRGGGM